MHYLLFIMKCAIIIIDIIIHCVYYSLWEKEPPNGARLTYLSVLPLMDDAGTLGTLIQNKYKNVPENRYNKEGYAQVSGTIS